MSTNKNVKNVKNDKNEKNVKEEKKRYADFVSLSEEEYQNLTDKLGENKTKDLIEALNLWKGSKGKKTKSDYLTILNWNRRDEKGASDAKRGSRTQFTTTKDSGEKEVFVPNPTGWKRPQRKA